VLSGSDKHPYREAGWVQLARKARQVFKELWAQLVQQVFKELWVQLVQQVQQVPIALFQAQLVLLVSFQVHLARQDQQAPAAQGLIKI
jgi:hypothetical protein